MNNVISIETRRRAAAESREALTNALLDNIAFTDTTLRHLEDEEARLVAFKKYNRSPRVLNTLLTDNRMRQAWLRHTREMRMNVLFELHDGALPAGASDFPRTPLAA